MKATIRRSDCIRQTFHCGGKGGQNVNKTETGVRYIHEPTGIRAEGRSERSQHQNDEAAWGLLIAKIGRLAADRAAKESADRWAGKPEAAFSSQIRSYVFDGNARRVVDHVTGHQSTDPAGVVGRGKIDGFLRAAMEGRRS